MFQLSLNMLNIVATPIGNLDDLSLRQVRTLLSSDIILAEDTRSAKILLDAIKDRFPQLTVNYQSISAEIISYYKEKEFEKLPVIIDRLMEDKKVSLISESGMPLVCDPGYLLVKACIKKRIPYTVIPGPSAVTNAIVMSGFDPSQFSFLGFIPKKASDKIKLFKKILSIKDVLPKMSFIFYDSPKRINDTLLCLKTLNWNADVVICREISKKFEEVIRGKPSELIKRQYKGEITFVVG